MKKTKILAAVMSAAMAVSALSIAASAEKLKMSENGVMIRYSDDGNSLGLYTGWAKTKGGRVYYRAGSQLSGWQYIKGKRYHFGENGCADTGSVKIADCTYRFDSKGVWTGKRSKTGERPADFNVRLSNYLNSYDSKEGKIRRALDQTDDGYKYAYADLKLSNKDKQIVWSVISGNGLLSADTKKVYDEDYVFDFAKSFPDKEKYSELMWWEPSLDYTLEITADGRTYKFTFYEEIQQISADDSVSAALWGVKEYLWTYMTESKAYKSLPRPSESMYID